MRGAPELHAFTSRQSRRRQGFTLAELLVAVGLLSIVMTAVYVSFNSAVRVWRTSEKDLNVYQDARIAMSIMTNDLQNVVGRAVHLVEGDTNSIEFFAVVPPMAVEDDAGPRIMWVQYHVKPDPNEKGGTIVREERVVESEIPLNIPPDDENLVQTLHEVKATRIRMGDKKKFDLVSGVLNFDLSYYWIPPPDQPKDPTQSLKPEVLPPVILTKNPAGRGLPQAVGIDIALFDPTPGKKRINVSTVVAFKGPTTPYDENKLGQSTTGGS